MRRAFVSLYILVAAAIAGIGWGLDQLWDLRERDKAISALHLATLGLLQQQLANQDAGQQQALINQFNQQPGINIQLYDVNDLSSSTLAEKIANGQAVRISKTSEQQTLYQKQAGSSLVLALTETVTSAKQSWLYTLLTIIFYLSLAGVILFWLWPLWLDLQQLEHQTLRIGEHEDNPVKLRPGSPLQSLANAFNRMSSRVKESIAARKEMTYAVSHELRTPLARMKFSLQMARDNQDSQNIKQQLEGVQADIDALDHFVNELLSYASFDQSEQALNISCESFQEVCQAIISGQLTTNSMIRLSIDTIRPETAASPAYRQGDLLQGDWRLLELAITNVVQNALRYANSEIKLSLQTDQTNAIITIDDDGPGIKPEDTRQALQPFVRLQQPHPNKGYGLGLAIVKRVMQWHGGNVTIEQSPLGGVRCCLRWPLNLMTDQRK